MSDKSSCQVEGCERPHLALGLCSAHYQRKRKGRQSDFESIRAYGARNGVSRTDPLTDAWAAGVIDGEGCIHLSTGTYATLGVTVGQSGEEEPPMLTRLLEVYGGKLYKRKYSHGRRRVWAWGVYSGVAEDFLRRVTPHMVQKRVQAEVALEYRENAIGKDKRHLVSAYAERLRDLKRL